MSTKFQTAVGKKKLVEIVNENNLIRKESMSVLFVFQIFTLRSQVFE